MRWILLSTLLLQGCAGYTIASGTSYLITDKTLTDHAATLVTPNGSCSTAQVVKGQYYCEIRDISTTYNRNPY